MRYELKFTADDLERQEFAHWLAGKPYFARDFPSRTVNSLYFDTPNFCCARDNLIGIGGRKKFRIRWYGDEDNSSAARYEVKIREGRLGSKHVAPLGLAPSELLAASPHALKDKLEQTAGLEALMPPGVPLWPVLFVQYERAYFRGPHDVRVTIDQNVRFADRWMERSTKSSDLIPWHRNVVEFKFDPSASQAAANMMSDLRLYPTRNSKYLAGLSLFRHAFYL